MKYIDIDWTFRLRMTDEGADLDEIWQEMTKATPELIEVLRRHVDPSLGVRASGHRKIQKVDQVMESRRGGFRSSRRGYKPSLGVK